MMNRVRLLLIVLFTGIIPSFIEDVKGDINNRSMKKRCFI